jgi:hypothetical protein
MPAGGTADGGTAGGAPDGGAPDSSGPATDVTVRVFPDGAPALTNATANADLVAFQDGDGDWTEVTGTDGVYHLGVHGDRYGVAVGCNGRGNSGTEFYYQSVAEAGELAVGGCIRPLDLANLAITIDGTGSDSIELWVGGSLAFAEIGHQTIVTVDAGAKDILALDARVSGRRHVYRGPIPDAAAHRALTIDWSQASPPVGFPLAISDPANAPGVWGVVSSYLVPRGRASRTIEIDFDKPSTYTAVPEALRKPGEIIRVEASETGNPVGPTTSLLGRSAFQEMATPAAVTLSPADYLSVAEPTIDTNAVSQLSVTVPIHASQLGHTVSVASFTTSTVVEALRYQRMFVRPGWAAGAASVALRVPDLRNLASWTTDMELSGRTEVDWSVSVRDQDQPLDAPVGQGRRGVESRLSGKVLPPARAAADRETTGDPVSPPRRSPRAWRAL